MAAPAVAPVLSTPDTHIFEADVSPAIAIESAPRITDEELALRYEIGRTIEDIRGGRYRRIALQFPDDMLRDAPRVYDALRGWLKARRRSSVVAAAAAAAEGEAKTGAVSGNEEGKEEAERLFILGDTSYGACCVDEVAAEHVDADVVVHYGRSCLSPTARLPVIYVFTTRELNLDYALQSFQETWKEKDRKVILMADIPYASHLPTLLGKLHEDGYTNVFATEIVHDPSSPLPNRTVPAEVREQSETLRDYELFHISEPPTSLLLTLSSRVGGTYIFPTDQSSSTPPKALVASTAMALRRRYALLTKLSTVSVFGILINTLSVKNYLHVLDHVKEQIEAAGKKSYTFVVGKINAAKVANFSEVGGWVVIGCWESSLIESKDFWKPIITPFELTLALQGDEERVWTGDWTSDFEAVLAKRGDAGGEANGEAPANDEDHADGTSESDGEESAPPEFDLRTGRYVSHSRPLQSARSVRKSADSNVASSAAPLSQAQSLVKRAKGDVAQIGGVVSPGAEYLRSQRTWQGLGSDFEVEHAHEGSHGAAMEEGRSGLARGYVVGDDRSKT